MNFNKPEQLYCLTLNMFQFNVYLVSVQVNECIEHFAWEWHGLDFP